MANRIRLNVEEPGGIDRAAWPITQGVPFPDGELAPGTPVRVVASDGAALPAQSACLATWDRDMAWVKWLLVDFQADLKANERAEFFLEYGPDIEPAAPRQPVLVEHKDQDTLISTGVLELVVRDGNVTRGGGDPDFFRSCRIKTADGWRDMFRARPGPFLYMTDQDARVFASTAGAPKPQVTIEEAGPMRACLCVKGFHATRDGLRLCPFVLRVHLYAGKSDLRFHHTFVFDQNPDTVELSSIGMMFPLDLGDDLRMAFGGEGAAHFAEQWEQASLVQTSDIEYAVTCDGKPFGSGSKTRGWAGLCGGGGSAVIGLRNLWQEYPKGFGLHHDGTMDVQIWPGDCGRNLAFTTPYKETAAYFGNAGEFSTECTRDEEFVKQRLALHPTAPLNLKSFNVQTEADALWVETVVEKHAPDRPKSHNDTGITDGTGAAKTTEFVLRLSPDEIPDEQAEAFAAAIQEPVIAPPDAAYTCATGVIGSFQSKGDARFAEMDRGLDDILEIYVIEPRELCRRYGMMRHGNMVCSHSAGVGASYRYWKDKDPSKALRFVGDYNNEANDQTYAVWCNFVHSGERKHFLLAEAFSGSVADVAICHAHPSDPAGVGLIHYHNAHVWSGGFNASHALNAGCMLHYYFTGNRRLLDVALEIADWAVRWQEPCGIISNREGILHREMTGPLWNVVEAYKATWAPKYGDLARRTLNWILKAQPQPGTFPTSILTRGERGDEAWVQDAPKPAVHQGGVTEMFRDAVRLFPSELLRKTLIAEADHYIWHETTQSYFTEDMAKRMLQSRSKMWSVNEKWYWTQWGAPPSRYAGTVALAYELTGDPVYAAWSKFMLEVWFTDYAERLRSFCPCVFSAIGAGSVVPVFAATAAAAMKKDPEGLAAAEEAWRKKRAELGNPIYDGPVPGIPIDREHMDPNGGVISMPPAEIDLPEPVPRPEPRRLGVIDCEMEGNDE